uniref:Transmembrane protein n=1 Tax=Panagrellus redivivus TaxID=6233 RepID=A0A7E4ZZT1_PANRE
MGAGAHTLRLLMLGVCIERYLSTLWLTQYDGRKFVLIGILLVIVEAGFGIILSVAQLYFQLAILVHVQNNFIHIAMAVITVVDILPSSSSCFQVWVGCSLYRVIEKHNNGPQMFVTERIESVTSLRYNGPAPPPSLTNCLFMLFERVARCLITYEEKRRDARSAKQLRKRSLL